MSKINKGLLLYRWSHENEDPHKYRQKVLKHGLYLGSLSMNNEYYRPEKLPLLRRVLKGKRVKRLPASQVDFKFSENQECMRNFHRIPALRQLKFSFRCGRDLDFYYSDYSGDSQFTVHSDFDEEIPGPDDTAWLYEKNNKRMLRNIFKQAKRVTRLNIYIDEMNRYHHHVLRHLPLASGAENISIKILIRSPDDLRSLRKLLKNIKQRSYYWPNLKSMVLKLRYPYNKQNCIPRFIDFCQKLQDLAHSINDSPRIEIRLKIKYMRRLSEAANLILQETLQKISQLTSLSLVLDTSKDLVPLFGVVEGLKNLQNYSLNFEKVSQEYPYILNELIQTLSKVESLKSFKINKKNLLGNNSYEDNEDSICSKQMLLKSLGDLSQITSFSMKRWNHTIDPTLWTLFSESVARFSKLEIFNFENPVSEIKLEDQSLMNFEVFFAGLKNLENLRIFRFEMCSYSDSFKGIGSQVFPVFCDSLQSLKKLEKAKIGFPWKHLANTDIGHLANVLPRLEKLQDFSLKFYRMKTSQPVENDVLMSLSIALYNLREIKSFEINMELKDVCDFTYDILSPLCQYFKDRRANLYLDIQPGDQVDEEVSQKIKKLDKIYLRDIAN